MATMRSSAGPSPKKEWSRVEVDRLERRTMGRWLLCRCPRGDDVVDDDGVTKLGWEELGEVRRNDAVVLVVDIVIDDDGTNALLYEGPVSSIVASSNTMARVVLMGSIGSEVFMVIIHLVLIG